jgi:hypothetical protein
MVKFWISMSSFRLPAVFLAFVMAASGLASLAQAEEQAPSTPSSATEGAGGEVTAGSALVIPSLHEDALGRPFPDPELLRRSEGLMALGITLSASGGALMVAGITLGTSIARGEVLVGGRSRWLPVGLMAGGSMLGLAGVPLASSGAQMRAQLLRKVKGVEKLPRTVANERRYWDASLKAQYGRTITISGGASILMGTLALAAVVGLVGTPQYDPRFWAAPAVAFAMGGGFIPAGMVMRKRALAAMEAVRDEVDPLRQPGGALGLLRRPAPKVAPPRPLLSMTRDDNGRSGLVFGLAWSGAL